jgi:hypothetical protein
VAACPFCSKSLCLKPGGSAFLFSQVLMHLRTCASRPATSTHSELIVICLDLADKAFQDLYGQQEADK